MENMQRPIILHFHIFKNAGTTIEWILEKNFPKHAVRIDPENPKRILTIQTVIDYLKKNKGIHAVSSHQIRFPIPQTAEFLFLPIIFIRNPIDRAISVYKFNRRRKDVITPGIKMAKELNLPDYINWNLNHKQNATMKNYQVLFLSHQTNIHQPLDDNDYSIATSNLTNSIVLGLVDRFDESMVVAEESLRNYFENVDFSYIQQETSPHQEQNLDERLKKIQSEIDGNTWNALLEQNEFDLKLYSDINTEFDQRIKKINNFGSKLKTFKNRCSQLPENLSIGNFQKRIRLKVNN